MWLRQARAPGTHRSLSCLVEALTSILGLVWPFPGVLGSVSLPGCQLGSNSNTILWEHSAFTCLMTSIATAAQSLLTRLLSKYPTCVYCSFLIFVTWGAAQPLGDNSALLQVLPPFDLCSLTFSCSPDTEVFGVPIITRKVLL